MLRSLEHLSDDSHQRVHIILCGRCSPENVAMKRLIERLSNKFLEFLSVDLRFVPDSELRAMIEQVDCVVIPYRRTEYSSGVLANLAERELL